MKDRKRTLVANNPAGGWTPSPDNNVFGVNLPEASGRRVAAIPSRWFRTNNVVFRRDGLEKRKGDSSFLSSAFTEDLERIDQLFKYDGSDHLIFVTRTEIARYDVATKAKVTLDSALGGSSTKPWHTEFYNNKQYFMNNLVGLRSWDGIAATTTLELSDPRGSRLGVFEDHLFVIDIVEGATVSPHGIMWSDNGDPTNFTVSTTTSAGRIFLRDDASHGLGFSKVGPFFYALKERAIYNLSPVGGAFVFQAKPIIVGIGPLSSGSYIDLGDQTVMWGQDDFYTFDGINLVPLGPRETNISIKKMAFQLLSPSGVSAIVATFIEEEQEIYWSFPSTSSPDGKPDTSISYNLDAEAFSLHPGFAFTTAGYYREQTTTLSDSITATSDSITTLSDDIQTLANFPLNLIARAGGDIFKLFTSNQDGLGNPIDGYADIILIPIENESIVVWTMMKLVFDRTFSPVNVDVFYKGLFEPSESFNFDGLKKHTINTGDPYVLMKEMTETGRYLALRIRTSGADTPWRLLRFEVEYDLAGVI